jgi:hypothetical protein
MFDRLIPFLSSLVVFITWEFLMFYAHYFNIIAPAGLVLFFLLLLKLNNFHLKNKDFWLLLAPGAMLAILTTAFLLFLNNSYLRQAVIFLAVVAVYFFYSYLYFFWRRITSYTPLSLERISSYFNALNCIFLGVSLFGFYNLLNLKAWHLALAAIGFIFCLTYQFFWINKIGERQNLFASILISILMAEFFWAIAFFPVSHFISGLVFAIIYYTLISLTLAHFLEKINKKITRWYLLVGFICIFVILLSARWL